MSAADFVHVAGALFATAFIPSLPMLMSLRGSGPQYRAAAIRFLAGGYAAVALVGIWMVLGGSALSAGPRWWGPYRDLTFVLMGVWFTLLPLAIGRGNRALRAALGADRAADGGVQ